MRWRKKSVLNCWINFVYNIEIVSPTFSCDVAKDSEKLEGVFVSLLFTYNIKHHKREQVYRARARISYRVSTFPVVIPDFRRRGRLDGVP